jgi:hypothetical protein
VLAQRAADRDPGLLELGRHELLDERDARAAARAGPGAGLDARQVGAVVLGHGRADRARRDVVARADGRIVGQVEAHSARALGQQVGRGVAGQLAAQHRPQRRVRRRVPHQHATEQRPGVVREDELLVDTADRVGPDDLEGARRARERIPEARDVDAGELELGRGVGAREGRRAAEEAIDDDLGHRVPRGDEPDARTLDARDLARGRDRGVGAHARVVDHDPAARTGVEACRTRELVARRDARRDDDDVDVEPAAVGELQPPDRPLTVRPQVRRRRVDPHRDAELVDEPPQRLAPAEVDLCRHQVRAELDDSAARTECLQRARRLEPEQPAADDRSPHRPTPPPRLLLDPAAQGRDVVEGAVHEHAGQVVARDGRHGRTRARRENEVVIAPRPSARGRHRPVLPVDRDRRVAAHEPDRRVGPQRVVAEREVARTASREVARECHAVVRRPRLLREDRHVPASRGVAGAQRLDEPLGDHAAADDDELARVLG